MTTITEIKEAIDHLTAEERAELENLLYPDFLGDVSLLESRRNEPSEPLQDVLKELGIEP